MYLVWIREITGKERMVFEGVCGSVKQINYMFNALYKRHPEELVLEFELMREEAGQLVETWLEAR
jgi:hypothetical protein